MQRVGIEWRSWTLSVGVYGVVSQLKVSDNCLLGSSGRTKSPARGFHVTVVSSAQCASATACLGVDLRYVVN